LPIAAVVYPFFWSSVATVVSLAGSGSCPSAFSGASRLSRTAACPVCLPVSSTHRDGAHTACPL
jgi:hypothetical protein